MRPLVGESSTPDLVSDAGLGQEIARASGILLQLLVVAAGAAVTSDGADISHSKVRQHGERRRA